MNRHMLGHAAPLASLLRSRYEGLCVVLDQHPVIAVIARGGTRLFDVKAQGLQEITDECDALVGFTPRST